MQVAVFETNTALIFFWIFKDQKIGFDVETQFFGIQE